MSWIRCNIKLSCCNTFDEDDIATKEYRSHPRDERSYRGAPLSEKGQMHFGKRTNRGIAREGC